MPSSKIHREIRVGGYRFTGWTATILVIVVGTILVTLLTTFGFIALMAAPALIVVVLIARWLLNLEPRRRAAPGEPTPEFKVGTDEAVDLDRVEERQRTGSGR